MEFVMYHSGRAGEKNNTKYPNKIIVKNADDLRNVCRFDHVCVEFANHHRCNDDFVKCFAIAADCDNDNTEDPAAWLDPQSVAARLPGVEFYYCKSRNCDKVKHPGEADEHSERPRYHYYFPLTHAVPKITIARSIMARLLVLFPEFDSDGTKPAQFFFGHDAPETGYIPGEIDLAQFFINHPEIKESTPAADHVPAAKPAQTKSTIADTEDYFTKNYPDALDYFDPNNYGDWVFVGICLKAGKAPFEAFDKWSRKGTQKYKGTEDTWNKWNHDIKEDGKTTGRSLFYEAKNRGWAQDQEKLTGEYKRKHEERLQREAEQWNPNYEAGPAPLSWDDEITTDCPLGKPEYIDPETGEILPEAPAGQDPGQDPDAPAAQDPQTQPAPVPDAEQPIPGKTFYTTPGATDPEPDPEAPWEPLNKRAALPAFPLDKLPEWIKRYIENFSENTGISKDFCAACVLGAVSTVICGHLQVFFNGTHYEPAQLYTAFVGASGSMKSTAVKQFVGPARTWMYEKNAEVTEYNSGILEEIARLEDKLAKEKKKMTQTVKDQSPWRNDAVKAQAATIEDIKAQIEQKKGTLKTQFPVPFSDVTPEALIHAARKTNGATTIATSEGNIINVLTGRSYNQRGGTPNMDYFLNAYDGEPYHQYRVTTGEIDLPRVDNSMVIAMQPALLETLCNSPDATGRGLLQRFLLFAPDDPNTFIDHTLPNSSNRKLSEEWNKHICAIAERIMKPDAVNLTTFDLDMFADKTIREFWNYEGELLQARGATEDESITGWISKLHGKALRLAAILALLEDPEAYSISEKVAQTAVDLLKEYFIPHYFAVVGSIDNLSKEARQIANWIIRHANSTGERDRFQGRELQQYVRHLNAFKGKYGKENYQTAMAELIEKNFIRPGVPEKGPSGRGKPAHTWQVNPAVFEK